MREPELAGRTSSPCKKAQGEEDSSLNRLDREKVFAAIKGRHGVEANAGAEDNANDAEAKVVVKDNSDDNGASGRGPRRKTRAAKGSRSAVATTGQPKAGQDPNDPADQAGDGLQSTKASPRATIGGQGVPAKIVNGSSGDNASFASKEEDDKHDPDNKIAVEARFALGFWPSNEARAAAARLLDAKVVRGALAALRKDTDNEASLALAARATICNDVEFDKRSKVGANWHAKQGNHKDNAGRATKQEAYRTADQGGRTRGPQVLTADEETNVGTNLQANIGGRPKRTSRVGRQEECQPQDCSPGSRPEEGQPRGPPGRWEAQPPSVDGVVWHYRGNSGGNRTARKRCQFFLGHQKGQRSPSVDGVVWHYRGNPGETVQRGSAANFFRAPGKAEDPQVLTALYGTTKMCCRRCLALPREFRGKPDRAEALPILSGPPGRPPMEAVGGTTLKMWGQLVQRHRLGHLQWPWAPRTKKRLL